MSNPRTFTVEIDGELRLFTIVDTPHADEWGAGDPVPADKEILGYVTRHAKDKP